MCNWRGGEEISLALVKEDHTAYQRAFREAGYADIIVNPFFVGGQVRQFGNLSFSRIYDAGHAVPEDQPEAAYTVFERVIKGLDIGQGKEVDLSMYGTKGPSSSEHQNKVLEPRNPTCWIRDIRRTCTKEEQAMITKGEGVVKNGVWYKTPITPPEGQTTFSTPIVTSEASSLRSSFHIPFRLHRRQPAVGIREYTERESHLRIAAMAIAGTLGSLLLL